MKKFLHISSKWGSAVWYSKNGFIKRTFVIRWQCWLLCVFNGENEFSISISFVCPLSVAIRNRNFKWIFYSTLHARRSNISKHFLIKFIISLELRWRHGNTEGKLRNFFAFTFKMVYRFIVVEEGETGRFSVSSILLCNNENAHVNICF